MADSLVKAESPLLQQILADIKAAMKAHDTMTLEVLRTLHSDIKNVAINAQKEITDETVLDVLSKSIKQRNESIEMLRKGGREQNAQEEEKTLAVYQKYLPQQLTEEEVKALIAEIKAQVGAQGPKDMGKVMKELSPKAKGRFDGRRLSELVKEALV
ncbi:GatB/YqeY domain-containing protein [uncultured Fibrobacter sp.]|uniref:GatB/YqeY domain-containing protein n=1 Tax=uncultured Fibrobacter sp. TaxID=261512 RepID=UPI0025913119|nr:GatB/YqeY domain-containing protein [uncultured Fibrobacter sp.]